MNGNRKYMDKEEYLLHPTRASALAYWKTEKIQLPLDMLVLNEENFNKSILDEYNDTLYFKMLHKSRRLKQKYRI